ncbi:MAG TPA: alpha/beta family hydrolase [Solirubrobacteraceae bacterium]|nr:alpha/beta family hydrolase [Solirubrobacteraceae bacterium]
MAREPYRLLEIETPHGPAQAVLELPRASRAGAGAGAGGLMVLGHGAGGGIDSADLLAVAELARELGVAVARVLQPYRVAGRRAAAPAHQLDAAWLAVLDALRAQPECAAALAAGPLICGGRSSGARVACRTAAAAEAAGVLCLAFPLHPPGKPEKSRLEELAGVGEVPVLVVQGERDPFGMPDAAPPSREVVAVPGTHTLSSAATLAGIRAAVRAWLAARL